MSDIEWTGRTWNPTTGCTEVGDDCDNCYARTIAEAGQRMKRKGFENGFEVTLHPHRLSIPLKRKKPTIYFVNSMSDLYHPDIPDNYIQQVFSVMNSAPRHIYQILTKRPARVAKVQVRIPPHIWVGTTIGHSKYYRRVDVLRQTELPLRFLSCEPLLSPLPDLNLDGIHWVIVGGESGRNARPLKKEWILEIKDKCDEAKVPFFFKQWGEHDADGNKVGKAKAGRLLDGKIYGAMPQGINIDLF